MLPGAAVSGRRATTIDKRAPDSCPIEIELCSIGLLPL
jgi:hypothetical protein